MTGNDLRAILSKNIKLHRGYHGLSQAELAEKANISITFLSSIERGTKWPYPDTIVKIAKALKVEEFELFQQKKPITDETTTLIDRLVTDISASITKSIEKTYRQYRGKKRT